MAEDGRLAAVEAQDDEIFVYMGGHQQVPDGVRRARIHHSVKIIRANAFDGRRQLISVEFHDGIEIIEEESFCGCDSLSGSIKLLGIRIIKANAFAATDLTDVEFGDKLETIEQEAFFNCPSLRTITMPHVRTIGGYAFNRCKQLTDLDLPEGLETSHENAFGKCDSLRRIALPLKGGLIACDAFNECRNLTTVDLVGLIQSTVASLHMEGWRNEMTDEINRINELLPNTTYWKTLTIRLWIGSVISRINHYKSEHGKMLKEATTLLELALWKVNLDEVEGGVLEKEGVRTTRRQRKRARKEISITSGASIVIRNVLPFLELNGMQG